MTSSRWIGCDSSRGSVPCRRSPLTIEGEREPQQWRDQADERHHGHVELEGIDTSLGPMMNSATKESKRLLGRQVLDLLGREEDRDADGQSQDRQQHDEPRRQQVSPNSFAAMTIQPARGIELARSDGWTAVSTGCSTVGVVAVMPAPRGGSARHHGTLGTERRPHGDRCLRGWDDGPDRRQQQAVLGDRGPRPIGRSPRRPRRRRHMPRICGPDARSDGRDPGDRAEHGAGALGIGLGGDVEPDLELIALLASSARRAASWCPAR